MTTTFDEIKEDEARTKRVGRLSDMDTREVSLVDRAANQRRFLTVKRHQEEHMGATATTEIETENASEATSENTSGVKTSEATAPEVAKGMAVAVLDEVHERVEYLESAVDAAEIAKGDSAFPASYGREARAIQILLKSLAGVTCRGAGLLIPVATDLDGAGAITKADKTSALKVLQEVSRRIESMKVDLAGCDMLDAVQARSLNATADLMARVPQSAQKGQALILLSSLSAEQRAEVLSAVEKSMTGLADVYVALQTDMVEQAENVADQFAVGSVLHGYAASLEKAVASILEGTQGEVDLIDAAVEEMRALQSVERAYTVKSIGGEFVVVEEIEGGDDRVHASSPDMSKAAAMAARMNAKRANAKTAKMETLMKVMNVETDRTSTEGESKKTETEKVGRPMQGDRLNRLRGAVTMLKDALGDLRAGSVSMEKFKRVGDVLASLINELQVEKRAAMSALTGVEDKRTASPEAPNMGSGVQPDTGMIGTMDDVMGEGTGNTADLLKSVEGMIDKKVSEVAKAKDAEIAKLKGELTSLRKARSAPSTPPNDGEINVFKGAGTESASEGDDCYWPQDLASWDGSETRD